MIHPGFLTRLLATEIQSPPPSPSPPGIAFELDCSYHLRVIYENINSESHDYIQKEPSALACNIANPFPLDLWDYVYILAVDLIYELVVYGKSLSARPSEVSSMDLAISYKHNQSLQPTLLAIIFVYDVFRVSLPR